MIKSIFCFYVKQNMWSQFSSLVWPAKQDYDDLFPTHIKTLIGRENLDKATKIEWKQQWLGSTDYIDRVKPEDITNNISYGVDNFKRPFVFVKVKIITSTAEGHTDEKTCLLIIFQRYTDDPNLYVCIDPPGYLDKFIRGNCAITSDFKELLTKFFAKGVYEGAYSFMGTDPTTKYTVSIVK